MKESNKALLERLKNGPYIKKTLNVISECPLKHLPVRETALVSQGINMVIISVIADLQGRGYLTMDCIEQLINPEGE